MIRILLRTPLSIVLLAGVAMIAEGCSSSSPRRDEGRRFPGAELRGRRTPERHGHLTYLNLVPRGLNRDRVLLDVVSYLGVPYEYGSTGREGIDCSGFSAAVYASAAGVRLPRSTRDQFAAGVPVDPDSLMFGDLVFFDIAGVGEASHVGIYLEDDLFAHASVTQGVALASLEGVYYRTRFLGARRIIE